jgi:glycosyltransferase involved in cell wall biosynthesis
VRVLFLNPGAELGGAERSLLDIIEALRASAHPPSLGLICLEDGPLVYEARRAGVDVSVVELPPKWRRLGDTDLAGASLAGLLRLAGSAGRDSLAGLRATKTLNRAIRRFRPNLVHSNGFKTHVLSVFATPFGMPIIWHIRDVLSRRNVMKNLLSLLQPRVSLILANSDFVARDAAKILRSSRIITLLNAIDVDWFSPGSVPPADLDLLAKLPPLQDAVRVGLIATYAPWKGHAVFLKAAAMAMRLASKRLRFYIIGGPVYSTATSQLTLNYLKRLLRDLDLEQNAGLVSFQRDPRSVYAALDVVTHASTAPEPFGRTIIEAMAMERAVIAAAGGAVPEVMQPGVDGLAVPPADPRALAAAIARLANDEEFRERLARAGRANAVLRFGRARLAPALATLYTELVEVRF